jgi:hypothetical protein
MALEKYQGESESYGVSTMPNATVRANARALPTVRERTEVIDGQRVRVECGFVDNAPPRLTIEQIIAMTDAELVAVIVASANPESLWPQMILAATELERRRGEQ